MINHNIITSPKMLEGVLTNDISGFYRRCPYRNSICSHARTRTFLRLRCPAEQEEAITLARIGQMCLFDIILCDTET